MNLKFLSFYILYSTSVGIGQVLDDDVCYKEVKPRLDDLIDLYKKFPSISKLPAFPDINSLIDEVEDIISKIVNLENAFNKSEAIKNDIPNKSQEVEDLKNILDLLKSIIREIDQMNQRKNIHNEAINTCSEASRLYEKLREDVADIKDTGNAIKTAIDKINKRIRDVDNKSLKVKSDLDSIKIPALMFQRYVCDTNLRSNIQNIIDSIRRIADLLRQKFQGVIKEKLQKIKNDSDGIGNSTAKMANSLNEDVPKSDIKITNATRDAIEDLKNKIKNLRNKLKNINLDRTSDDFLKSVEEKLKRLLSEYETVLKHLFSKENMEKAEKELETVKKTLDLLNKRTELKGELDNIKKIVNILLTGGVCSADKVNIEL